MLPPAAATPWEGMLLLQPGLCVPVPPCEILRSDLVKDSTEAQTTEGSDLFSLVGCAFPGSQANGDSGLARAGHRDRNQDMHGDEGKASYTLGWLYCARQRTNHTSMMERGPQLG